MLAELPPGVLNEWMAFDRIEYDTETALERIATILQLGFRAVMQAAGCKDVPHDIFEPDPARRVGDCEEMMTPKQVAEKLKSFPQAW